MRAGASVSVLAFASSLLGRPDSLRDGDPLTGIEIVPYEIVVGSYDSEPTTFELEARLWVGSEAARRPAPPESYSQVVWTASETWLTLQPSTGRKPTFRIEAKATPGNATVKAEVGGLTATASIKLVPATLGSHDVVTVNYSGKEASAILVNGAPQGSPGTCNLLLFSSVRRATFDNLGSACPMDHGDWGAAIFSHDHQVVFLPPNWTSADDTKDAAPQQGPRLDVPVALRVMIYDDTLDAAGLKALRDSILEEAKGEIKAADSLLAESRVGIRLTLQDARVIPISDMLRINSCADGDYQTSTYDGPPVLHAYYVDDLGDKVRGLTCPGHNQRPWDVIYVGVDLHSPATFIHELGHAFALTVPGYGHSDVVAGFDRTNVMNSVGYDDDPEGRHRLSIGQAFRMNADPSSWLNRGRDVAGQALRPAAAKRLDCQCGNRPPGECAELAEDVAARSKSESQAESWDCDDQIWFTEVTDTDNESPVAILVGRNWRALPSNCSIELKGATEKHWAGTFIRFDNLTNAAACPSWAAVFFARHRPLYLPLPADALVQVADVRSYYYRLSPPVVFDVQVYSPAGVRGLVEHDSVYARETFGESNRAGIDLQFTMNPDVPCPTETPAIHALVICYAQSAPVAQGQPAIPEAELLGPHRITIWLDARNETTASHFIGRALGLNPLTPPGDPDLTDNIMNADYTKRGKALTLGQVFRIHVPLSPAWPRCDKASECPSLGVGP